MLTRSIKLNYGVAETEQLNIPYCLSRRGAPGIGAHRYDQTIARHYPIRQVFNGVILSPTSEYDCIRTGAAIELIRTFSIQKPVIAVTGLEGIGASVAMQRVIA